MGFVKQGKRNGKLSWSTVRRCAGFPRALVKRVLLVLLFLFGGSVFYFGVPEFRRRVDYIPIRIYMLFLEQKRRRQSLVLPTPVASVPTVQDPFERSTSALIPSVPAVSATPTETATLPFSSPHTAEVTPTLTSALGLTSAAFSVLMSTVTGTPTPSSTPTATSIPEPTVDPTSTSVPTLAPTLVPIPTSTPGPAHTVIELSGVQHTWQGWNNCAPANLSQVLSYYGYEDTQYDVQEVVKPNKWDLNVSPYELAGYARALGLEALAREGGKIGKVKRFIDHRIPVMLEIWYYPDEHGGGHYRTIIGYDETAQELIASDTQLGPGYRISYTDQYQEWLPFNWLYLVVYRSEQANIVHSIVGDEMDDMVMYQHALMAALAELSANPDDAFTWFTVGTNYAALGDYAEAAVAYDQARVLGVPFRMPWYQFGPFEAYLNLRRYQDVIDLATANLNMVGNQEESHYYLGRAQQALGNLSAARQSYQQALKYNPGFTPAIEALASLE